MQNPLKLCLAALATVAFSSVLTQSKAQTRLIFDGTYALTGVIPDGSGTRYSGTLTATTNGEGYRLKMVFGSVTLNGIGLDNSGDHLAGSYIDSSSPTTPVVSLYRVTAPNTLSGTLMEYNFPNEGSQKAVLSSRTTDFVAVAPVIQAWDFAGTYTINGNWGGNKYSSPMTLTAYGDGYRVVSTRFNGARYNGIAVYDGNVLAVAWNYNNTVILVIYDGDPRTYNLSGYYLASNSPIVGVETATWR